MNGTYRAVSIVGLAGLVGTVVQVVLRSTGLVQERLYVLPPTATAPNAQVLELFQTIPIMDIYSAATCVGMAALVLALMVAAQAHRLRWLVAFVLLAIISPYILGLIVDLAYYAHMLPMPIEQALASQILLAVFRVAPQVAVLTFAMIHPRHRVMPGVTISALRSHDAGFGWAEGE